MDNFVEVYKKWLIMRQQTPTPESRRIMVVLDNTKKKAWNSLPEDRRVEIVAELILDGILPHSVVKLLDIFEGKVVGI